jgi:hypothetical protein
MNTSLIQDTTTKLRRRRATNYLSEDEKSRHHMYTPPLGVPARSEDASPIHYPSLTDVLPRPVVGPARFQLMPRTRVKNLR